MYAMIKQKNTLSALPPIPPIHLYNHGISPSLSLSVFLHFCWLAVPLYLYIYRVVVGYYMGGRCGWIHKTQDQGGAAQQPPLPGPESSS